MEKNQALDLINKLVEENFTDYMIVLVDGPMTFSKYKSKLSAMGMCKMVENDIKLSWDEKGDSAPKNKRINLN